MRCLICDYSDGEAKSLYNFSLVDPKGHKRRYVLLTPEGDELCNYCYETKEKDFDT